MVSLREKRLCKRPRSACFDGYVGSLETFQELEILGKVLAEYLLHKSCNKDSVLLCFSSSDAACAKIGNL